MVEKFHEELKGLKEEVLVMGLLSRGMLCDAVKALRKKDEQLANEVSKRKDELADMDEQIENKALRLIALYQPMAKDMRAIACCLKMNTYLARIGRYGKDIAKVAIELGDKPHIAKMVSIPHMAELVDTLIDDALCAYETENLSFIKDFRERDDDIDALRYSIFRECLSYMMEDSKTITQCTNYAMVARYLERCGDHACKMAEKIHYMISGERIEIK